MDKFIRQATASDSQIILQLINELAHYEKEPDAVKTTEADIIRDGFGETSFFKALICEHKEKPVGFALYFYTWSTWEGRPSLYLEDLFVLPEYRGEGFGLSLFKKLASIANENKCKRIDWSVLDWNTPAINFYDKIGAKHMKEWWTYRLEGEALVKFSK